MNYYIAVGIERRGPFLPEQLLSQGLRPDTLVWTEGMPQWQRADSRPDLRALLRLPGPPPPPLPVASAPSPDGTKMAAGLCAILVGAFGVHKFILGMNRAGIIMILVTVLTCGVGAIAMHIIAIIEGVSYLTKSDEEFRQIYIVQKKEWF